MKTAAFARTVLLAVFAVEFVGTIAVAQQKFPTGTVRIVAPYVPGGAVDIAARALADLLAERWGSAVIVENRTGAATSIGTNAVATANPDGHTLLLTDRKSTRLNSSHANISYAVFCLKKKKKT